MCSIWLVCVQTLPLRETEKGQSPEYFEILGKNTIFNEHPVLSSFLITPHLYGLPSCFFCFIFLIDSPLRYFLIVYPLFMLLPTSMTSPLLHLRPRRVQPHLHNLRPFLPLPSQLSSRPFKSAKYTISKRLGLPGPIAPLAAGQPVILPTSLTSPHQPPRPPVILSSPLTSQRQSPRLPLLYRAPTSIIPHSPLLHGLQGK